MASVVTVALPVTLPLAVGDKVTFKVALCPGASICPVDTPLALNPGPAMLTFKMAASAFPVFVIVTGRVPLLPIGTLPNARLDGLAVIVVVVASGETVRVTGMDRGKLTTPKTVTDTLPL